MTYGHLQADCLYTGISSGTKAQCRVWEAFTFLPLSDCCLSVLSVTLMYCGQMVGRIKMKLGAEVGLTPATLC